MVLQALLQPLLLGALALGPGAVPLCLSSAHGVRHCAPLAVLSVPPPTGPGAGSGEEPLRPVRRTAPGLPTDVGPPGVDGFVFGEASVERVIDALRDGGVVLLAEDGGAEASLSLLVSPQHVTPAQVDFLREHAVRLQVPMAPDRYRRVYSSLHQIVLDNSNLEQPALSVSVADGDGSCSPQDSAHVAATIHALLEAGSSDSDARAAGLTCPGAVSLTESAEGGVLRRLGLGLGFRFGFESAEGGVRRRLGRC